MADICVSKSLINPSQGVSDRSRSLGDRSKSVSDRANDLRDRSKDLSDRSKGIDERSKGVNDRLKGINDVSKSVSDRSKTVRDRSKNINDRSKNTLFRRGIEELALQSRNFRPVADTSRSRLRAHRAISCVVRVKTTRKECKSVDFAPIAAQEASMSVDEGGRKSRNPGRFVDSVAKNSNVLAI
jgi:hypothetical protein